MDLHIPANIMLAASILLSMKSETINIFTEEIPVAGGRHAEPGQDPRSSGADSKIRLQPKRKITLNELMDALGDAIKINERRETIVKQRAEPLNFTVEKDDIDEKISAAHALIKKSVDKEGITTFAELSKFFNSLESMLLKLFIPLLFLAHKGDIMLMQDQFFNEIFVKLNDGSDGKQAK